MGHPQPIKIVIIKVSQITENSWYVMAQWRILGAGQLRKLYLNTETKKLACQIGHTLTLDTFATNKIVHATSEQKNYQMLSI